MTNAGRLRKLTMTDEEYEEECEYKVLLEGWLQMLSNKEGNSWKLRYVSLQSDNILKYANEDHKPKGQIDIHPFVIVRHFGNCMATPEGQRLLNSNPHGYEVYESQDRSWYFDPQNLEKLTSRVKALQYMIDHQSTRWLNSETSSDN